VREASEVGGRRGVRVCSRRMTERAQSARLVVCSGSHLAVPRTPGGGPVSGLKRKKHDQELTLGSKVGSLQESGRPPWRHRTAGCSPRPTFSGNAHAFSSRLSSLTKRQSVPSGRIAFGLELIMPTSWSHSA
jgi:hypothetical protein